VQGVGGPDEVGEAHGALQCDRGAVLVGRPHLVGDDHEVAPKHGLHCLQEGREEVAGDGRVVVHHLRVGGAREPLGDLDPDTEGARECLGHAGHRRADHPGQGEDGIFAEQRRHCGDEPERFRRVGGDAHRKGAVVGKCQCQPQPVHEVRIEIRPLDEHVQLLGFSGGPHG
jgi:hypothetical protein